MVIGNSLKGVSIEKFDFPKGPTWPYIILAPLLSSIIQLLSLLEQSHVYIFRPILKGFPFVEALVYIFLNVSELLPVRDSHLLIIAVEDLCQINFLNALMDRI